MTDIDDGPYWEPTSDDLQAQRILGLAILFMNSSSFVSSSEIHRGMYEGMEDSSFRRKFARDRESLALCGVILECKKIDNELWWRADTEASFVMVSDISPEDVMLLDLVCMPCLSNPTFAYREELRLALAKIDRSFGSSVVSVPEDVQESSPPYRKLQLLFSARNGAKIEYVDANGVRSERQIAPLGFFGLGENTYVVAARVDKDGSLLPGSVRTYAASRLQKADRVKGVTYEIPEDFHLDEYIRLPFQIGPDIYDASFLVPREAEHDLRADVKGKGSFEETGRGLVWTVPASNETAAAAYAITMSILPLSPASLVETWRGVLEGVVSRG